VAAAAEGDEEWRGFPEAGWLALGLDGQGSADPWDDAGRLQRIKAQGEATQGECYFWANGAMRCCRHGEVLEVPPPEERGALVEKAHAQLGHYGGGRTLSLLQNTYWWPGMAREVKGHVAQCLQCDRVRSRVAEVKRTLQSLPLVGVGQRWSLDYAGELPTSGRGKKYILVIIDHASKWVEAAATEDKSSATVARVFLNKVIARFGEQW